MTPAILAIVIAMSPAQRTQLAHREHVMDVRCRGGSGDRSETWRACRLRDALTMRLARR